MVRTKKRSRGKNFSIFIKEEQYPIIQRLQKVHGRTISKLFFEFLEERLEALDNEESVICEGRIYSLRRIRHGIDKEIEILLSKINEVQNK